MATLTLAAEIAWRFGANEALTCGSTVLEPVHLLVGILSVEKVFLPEYSEKMKLTEYGLSTVRVEWQESLRAVTASGMSPASLRRAIRAELPKKALAFPGNDKPKVQRSETCKAVFTKAGELAEAAQSTVAGIVYLLHPLVECGSLGLSPGLASQIALMEIPLATLVRKPLHTPISSIEEGYVSEQAIAPTIDRRRAKA